MNKIAKILIIIDVIFCISFTVFMGLGWLDISSEDIAKIGAIIMSPEILVGLNKACEKFQKNTDTDNDNKDNEAKK